jgi:hypothetical protein
MRPLALAALLSVPVLAFAGPREALEFNFSDGSPVASDVPKELKHEADAVRGLHAQWKAKSKMDSAVPSAYAVLFPKKDREDLLLRAKVTYGLISQAQLQKEYARLEAEAAKLPPDQQKVMGSRLSAMKAAFGKMLEGDGTGAGGVAAKGKDEALRAAELEKYKKAGAGKGLVIKEPGAPDGETVEFAGVKLNKKQQARVGDETSNLRAVLDADNLNGYMTETDKKQIVSAWGHSVARNVAADGTIPNMKKAVNDFRDILLNGREAGDGTTRVAEHWGEMAVGSYSVSPYAAIGASLAWNTFSITKGQLLRSWRYIRGTGPMPPAGNYWGEQMNKSLVTESAAAGWASALPGADEQKPLQGVVETLKLDEFAKFVSQEGVLTTAGEMGKRYSK